MIVNNAMLVTKTVVASSSVEFHLAYPPTKRKRAAAAMRLNLHLIRKKKHLLPVEAADIER